VVEHLDEWRQPVALQSHPLKVSFAETRPDPGIPERGWVGMDVRWLVTNETVGATGTVFGVTVFPPGARHEIHRHPNAEEVEYLVSGHGLAHVDDAAVELAPGEAVFVPRNSYHGFENSSDAEVVMAWCYSGAASLADAGFATLAEDQGAASA
jgi:quercetin dioxygenase-like cupin family protein